MERRAEKAERKRSQAKGCTGEGSDKQDVLSCIPEGDVEGCNRVCDENTNRHSALKEDRKPNMNVKIQRQKVPDDEDIDINKIV